MMKNIRYSLMVAGVLSVLLITSCTTEKVAVEPQTPEIANKVSPGPTYVLKGPEWEWDKTNKSYVFVEPEYVLRPEGGVWVRGHWKPVKGGKQWVPGYWK